MTRTITLILALSTTPVMAHDWYPIECCSGQDCAPIPDTAVAVLPDGSYRVVLKPGDHPLVMYEISRVFRATDRGLRWSHDAGYHACVAGGSILCFFIPGGV